MHKRTFDLRTGVCFSDSALKIATFPVRLDGTHVWVDLPRPEMIAAPSCDHDVHDDEGKSPGARERETPARVDEARPHASGAEPANVVDAKPRALKRVRSA
jgi:hypothetical protein